jgi:Arc/MetJ family transcription regulator
MRTSIVIDDQLMEEAMTAAGVETKREAVELGLRALVRLRRQADIREYRGRLVWQDNLDTMRSHEPHA